MKKLVFLIIAVLVPGFFAVGADLTKGNLQTGLRTAGTGLRAIGAALLRQALPDRLAETGYKSGDPVFIRIFKQEAELELWLKKDGSFELFETYPICSWAGSLGPKIKTGDRQSPEGFYSVTRGQLNPNSNYHLSFNLGYPNAYDRAHGRTGAYLMVHGNCVSLGCYAMTDQGIEEIYGLVEAALKAGQRRLQVHIFPFRMTEEQLELYSGSEWLGFWKNLREGYDFFEKNGQPPNISVKAKRYIFSQAHAILNNG